MAETKVSFFLFRASGFKQTIVTALSQSLLRLLKRLNPSRRSISQSNKFQSKSNNLQKLPRKYRLLNTKTSSIFYDISLNIIFKNFPKKSAKYLIIFIRILLFLFIMERKIRSKKRMNYYLTKFTENIDPFTIEVE